jgi:hypothetical protein
MRKRNTIERTANKVDRNSSGLCSSDDIVYFGIAPKIICDEGVSCSSQRQEGIHVGVLKTNFFKISRRQGIQDISYIHRTILEEGGLQMGRRYLLL